VDRCGKTLTIGIAAALALPMPRAIAAEPVAEPAGPSPVQTELRAEAAKGERIAIGGYVVVGVGGLVMLLGVPPLVAGRIDADDDGSGRFDTRRTPEQARGLRRFGTGMMLTGLGIAAIGGTLIGVGLSRKHRAERELQTRSARAPMVSPWLSPTHAGVALRGRF
jgi:hypothetical protein